MLDEFTFIEQIKQNYYRQPTLIRGIGDDAAVFRQSQQNIVTAVDTFVEDIHFSKETMKAFCIGYRGLAASVSDLAAMGADPKFYLVSIVVPQKRNIEEIKEIFTGMKAFAQLYNMDLIGGDTVSGSELAISVTVIGYVQDERMRYRHTAKDGDIVFVTGTLGDSQAGLYLLQQNKNVKSKHYFVDRHQKPQPRVHFAKALYSLKRVTLNDISDGIVNELYEIAKPSKVNILLKDQLMPVHNDLHIFPRELLKQWVYFGGEDFELVGTVPPKDWEKIQLIAKQTNTKVTKIGYVKNDLDRQLGQVFLQNDHRIKLLNKEGYTHLK